MDDNSFDELLRKKLDGYEDPVFDPSSFEAMKERLSAIRAASWYTQAASRIFVVSALGLFTLINCAFVLGVYSHYTTSGLSLSNNPPIDNSAAVITLRDQTIDSLNDLILNLKCGLALAEESHVSDQTREKPAGHSVRDNTLDKSVREILSVAPAADTDVNQPSVRASGDITAADHTTEQLSAELEQTIQGLFRLMNSLPKADLHSASEVTGSPAVISLSTQKSIEKHYFKGVGVELAPHVDLVQGIYKRGESGIHPRLGIALDLIVSPNFSIESGLDYLSTSSQFDPGKISLPDPPTDPNYGTLHTVTAKYNLVSVPVSFKYRQWINSTNQVFVKTGLTAFSSINRELQYTYQTSANPSDPDYIQLTTLDHHDDFKYFGTTANLTIGLTRRLKNQKTKFETSLFYEKGLGPAGQERLRMQLAGIRAAYWFNVSQSK